ncbi:MAG: LPXTG cell wall anchor domain-containing protein [Flavobacteriales bacterium]|jgi:LPXTG-motif cell wall-anchored protein|nr:LPXTG cell wall anchor domain-containing protein [Flavobacteriales bacterium]
MNTTRKIFEIAYLVFSIVFVVEAYLRWHTEPTKAYLFVGFSVLALFMFFFRRRFRKKSESYNKDSK